MHVNNAQQQQTITALAEALKDNDDTIIAATDATNSADFVKSYNQYPQAIKDLIDQYNVHAYSDGSQMQSRDIAQADGKKLSMSEVDGSWQSTSPACSPRTSPSGRWSRTSTTCRWGRM